MSLSPFDSFQSRFVTYLLNFPRSICNRPFNLSLRHMSGNRHVHALLHGFFHIHYPYS